MSELIQWPKAKYWTAQWNPIIGCKPCSPACENCYAAAWAKRFKQSFEPHESSQGRPPRKGVVFCGNMTDLFGEWMNVMDSMDCFSLLWHFPDDHSGPKPNDATYLFCTKRVDRMCDALRNYT
ncbi:MAG: phage Gp37/Gp68 family protein, partial [Kiritimatiellae bacterium]|nr:phage Gp37/Gp68 family protein [Kiritimatiellia bacterium]